MLKVWDLLLATEKIPVAGKYKCVICGLIVDVAPHFIERGATFFSCPICKAGTEDGPKNEEEEVWEYLG